MLTAVVFAAAAASAALAPNSSLFSDARPPARYQAEATVTLKFAEQDQIDAACHPRYGVPPAGMKTDACATGRTIIAPNPCEYDETDRYAHLLCHEMAHVNGWPATHGD